MTVLSFLQAPAPRNRAVRQGSLTTKRDFLVVIEMWTPKSCRNQFSRGFSQDLQADGKLLSGQSNEAMCIFGTLHGQKNRVSEDCPSLCLCTTGGQRVTAASFMKPYSPRCLSSQKSGQLHVSAFSRDFIFISLVEFRGAKAAWTLNKSKSWSDLKKSREILA